MVQGEFSPYFETHASSLNPIERFVSGLFNSPTGRVRIRRSVPFNVQRHWRRADLPLVDTEISKIDKNEEKDRQAHDLEKPNDDACHCFTIEKDSRFDQESISS